MDPNVVAGEEHDILVGKFMVDGYDTRKIWYCPSQQKLWVSTITGDTPHELSTGRMFRNQDEIISAYREMGISIQINNTHIATSRPMMVVGV